MARVWLITLLAAVTTLLAAPLAAQARTPCPGELAAPTALNAAQVNEAVVCLTNQVRGHFGLPALRRDVRLDSAATLHSVDMGTRKFFNHVNPDGLDPQARATAQGYTLGVGENIARGYPTARSVVLGWAASAGHCRNILSSARDVGVGTALVGTPHYTQVLGDYFTRQVSETPRSGCPYALNLDTLNAPAPAPSLVAGPAAQAAPAPADAAQPAAAAKAAKLSLRSLALAPSRFRAGRRGTTISYTLSAPATVTFRILRAKRSRGYRTLSQRVTHSGVAGVNRVRFTGRLAGTTLRPGRYRLEAFAADGAGAATRVARTGFQIVRR